MTSVAVAGSIETTRLNPRFGGGFAARSGRHALPGHLASTSAARSEGRGPFGSAASTTSKKKERRSALSLVADEDQSDRDEEAEQCDEYGHGILQ